MCRHRRAACAGIGALDVQASARCMCRHRRAGCRPAPQVQRLASAADRRAAAAAAVPEVPQRGAAVHGCGVAAGSRVQHQPDIFGLDARDGSLCSSAADVASLSQHLRHLSVTLSSGDISGHTVQVRRHDLQTTHLCLARPAGILAFLLVGNTDM